MVHPSPDLHRKKDIKATLPPPRGLLPPCIMATDQLGWGRRLRAPSAPSRARQAFCHKTAKSSRHGGGWTEEGVSGEVGGSLQPVHTAGDSAGHSRYGFNWSVSWGCCGPQRCIVRGFMVEAPHFHPQQLLEVFARGLLGAGNAAFGKDPLAIWLCSRGFLFCKTLTGTKCA